MNKTILIVEDEERMRKLISDYLKKDNFSVIEACDGEVALEKFKGNNVDLIVLDLMMPKLDGLSVCNIIRKNSAVPIIILTAKSDEQDKLIGFELGADEYVTKPFSPKVLVAQIKALLKRVEGTTGKSDNLIQVEALSIHTISREVCINQELITLSPKEYELLLYLVKNKGIALSRDNLLDNVWGYDYNGDLRTVDTHIKRLREKLKDQSKLITTVRGSGYKFEVVK